MPRPPSFHCLSAPASVPIGAGAGWLIDRLHKGKRPAAVPVAVAIRADRQERAVRLQWRF
jgi:hypothetical protein